MVVYLPTRHKAPVLSQKRVGEDDKDIQIYYQFWYFPQYSILNYKLPTEHFQPES